jgi:ferritin-like metal-binding protein YciE
VPRQIRASTSLLFRHWGAWRASAVLIEHTRRGELHFPRIIGQKKGNLYSLASFLLGIANAQADDSALRRLHPRLSLSGPTKNEPTYRRLTAHYKLCAYELSSRTVAAMYGHLARNSKQVKGNSMKLFSAHIEDLRSLYISDLRKALDMEKKITKALPDLIENASDDELARAFSAHLEETRGHVSRVESLLASNEGDTETETCKVIDGLITEASDTIKDVTDPSVRDISLIGAAQQVEHHEIAVYGTLRRWAELLGLTQDVTVLEAIEAEEMNADELLSAISERVKVEAVV